MQPVQFQCGHCGQLMAVSSEYLGQQVRCPHCQHVVVAPPPAPPTIPPTTAEAPAPALVEMTLPPPAEDVEDIFSPAETTEDLFGRSEAPRIEIPSDPLALPLSRSDAVPQPEPQVATFSMESWPSADSAAAPPPSLELLAPNDQAVTAPSEGMPRWPSGTLAETLTPPPSDAPAHEEAPPVLNDTPPASHGRARRRTEQKAPWFLLLVFCPLLLYAIVISVFAFLLYRDHQHLQEQRRNPFEVMPDVGDDPGVHRGKKVSLTDRYKPELATLPLPDSLCTTLGNPIRIGELEVVPNRVERKRMAVVVETSQSEPCSYDSLVLYLDMKNLASDYAFAPLDNYFDRSWRPGQNLIPPLTQLEIGNQYRCYGGPAYWYPRGARSRDQRQWIQGRHDQAELLQPGEEKELFVCTDGEDAQAAALLFGGKTGERYHGSLLWRIRVRRGLVRFQDKDYSATAVIGVRFADTDIREAS